MGFPWSSIAIECFRESTPNHSFSPEHSGKKFIIYYRKQRFSGMLNEDLSLHSPPWPAKDST